MQVPSLPWAAWVVVFLAVNEAGWMAFDGTRALIVGDYVTPKSGEYAGQLGPWAWLVSSIGIDPRSTFMKVTFALYGIAWLAFTAAFVFGGHPWTWWAMLIAAIGALWYLPFGTLLSLVQIVLLALPVVRGAYT